ncbi:hypothetical protein [Sphingobium sp. WCS2017Hpa-17]|uniref:hypothetical protein n=1 Tax=Sphingobium sp. WCS2017Hpa-17 TaxID=3073638 RepID=UPI00288B7656|nr:hypothetical protein [Sphingobium sp. WCS2017Hpa-17]
MARRKLLIGGMTSLAALGGLLAWRSRPLPPLPYVAPAPIPDRDTLWHWIERLNAFGPRLTASPAHQKSVDYIAEELAAMGLTVHRDTHRIRRWTPGRTALRLEDGTSIPVAAPYPYSGRTGPDGMTAPLVWFDNAPKDFSAARGKIAIVPVGRLDLTTLTTLMLFDRRATLPDESADIANGEIVPVLGPLTNIFLDRARAAGVRGVICLFEGLSDALAQGQVLPFTTPYADCPALWVGDGQRDNLHQAAARGASATLTLEATLADADTDTLHVVLEGSNPHETIIVNTHTDGPNACEENGPAGLLALARAHAVRQDRRRSIIFVFATGHFQIPQLVDGHGQATTAWLRRHPELWDGQPGHARAVAGLTLEHLGCMEWKDRDDRPAPTGRLEREIVYATNRQMEQVYRASVAGRSKLRSLVVAPRLAHIFLGEGAPLYQCGIPSISLVPGPDYLCQLLPDGGLDRLDADFAHQQVDSFSRALTLLDALPAAAIGSARPAGGLMRPLAVVAEALAGLHR